MLQEQEQRERIDGCRAALARVQAWLNTNITGSLHRACASGKILSTLRFVLTTTGDINAPNRCA